MLATVNFRDWHAIFMTMMMIIGGNTTVTKKLKITNIVMATYILPSSVHASTLTDKCSSNLRYFSGTNSPPKSNLNTGARMTERNNYHLWDQVLVPLGFEVNDAAFLHLPL